MPPKRVPPHAYTALVLLLSLAALLKGATLGCLLLPPGRLGVCPAWRVPGPQVQAVAAASRLSSPDSPAEPLTSRLGWGQIPPASEMRSRVVLASHPEDPIHQSSNIQAKCPLPERPHWRLAMQLNLSWQYAGGAESRWFSNPDSPAVGEPR